MLKIKLKKPYIKKVKELWPRTNIFLAVFPKSGSTYLKVLLMEITGYEELPVVQFYGQNEQDLYEPMLSSKLIHMNSVTHQHPKGTNNNVRLMKQYHIRPVILTRNIFDIVPSIHDRYEKISPHSPMGYVHKEYFEMSKDEKYLYIIRMHLPWYFNFFLSWREAAQEIDTLWITYKNLFSDTVNVASRILKFYGISVTDDRIESAISVMEGKDTRKNVGISGRGERLLNETHKKAILELASICKIDKKEMEIIGINL